MSLVAERLTQIARASGAMVGILDGKKLRYRAASGLTLPAGTEVPMEKALCVPCLRTGQVFRCADVTSRIPSGYGRMPAARHPVDDRGSHLS